MKRRRLLWRLFASYILVLALCVGISFVLTGVAARRAVLAEHERLLGQVASLHAGAVAGLLAGADTEPLKATCDSFKATMGWRATVVRADGTVVADSDADPSAMDNHRERPEIRSALESGRIASQERKSYTVLQDMLYVAVPLQRDGAVVGVLRLGKRASELSAEWKGRLNRAVVPVIAAGLVASIVAFLLARGLSRPFEDLRRGAERFGRGDLKKRVPSHPSLELGELADALNRMAAQLDERIVEITRQRNERQAVLESLGEGVLALDSGERILSVNRAAEELLGINGRSVGGRLVQEALRHIELQRILARALRGEHAAETGEESAPTIRGANGVILEVRSAPLRDDTGQSIGIVVILADVTRLHELENLRREFVANVSHELRTPITSIKGFAETLLDGALDDPEEARRFVEIINRQSDRLGGVIEDLLRLSRLDRTRDIEKSETGMAALAGQAVELCRPQAAEHDVELVLSCPADAPMRVNPVLLEQALTNLIDNAVKYSGPGKRVDVRVAAEGGNAVFEVRDNGPGIAAEHLPRLFERFYRVDKARSREVGGTGLGLSIVKHVAMAHGGSVEVESTVGTGTTFRMTIPRGVEVTVS